MHLADVGVQREDFKELLNKQLAAAAALVKCGISNVAREARDDIGITIDEYVIEQRICRENYLATTADHINVPDGADSPACSPDRNVSDQLEIFRGMEKLTSDELSFMFVGDKAELDLGPNNILEISARNKFRRVALSDFDLVDRRRGCLNRQGAMLLGMADTTNQSIEHEDNVPITGPDP